ncbi:MAG: sigma-54-dependent Fis family transcriptional regulator [Deltaproteobacteria bacterium]|nr:sigma-54-dependent Fis family transcriptional regulator [Deltaproteobacteria bacterium]
MSERFLLASAGTTRLRLALPELGRFALEFFPNLEILLDPEASIAPVDDPESAQVLRSGEVTSCDGAELLLTSEAPAGLPLLWVTPESWRRALARLPRGCALRIDGAVEPETIGRWLGNAPGPCFAVRSGRGVWLAFADEDALTATRVRLSESSRAQGLRLVVAQVAQPLDPAALSGGPAVSATLASIAYSDPAMLAVEALIDRAAPTSANVVIVGESGTGKDLVAQEILRRSGRTDRAVRTSAVALLEPEVLQANLREAEGAVLIIDEITALEPKAQLALAHGLDAAEGRGAPIRVLSLSSTALSQAVNTGQFRKELAYRLEALSITLPPLRQRRAEIAPLARQFAAELSTTLTSEAIAALEAHDFPGNVRELKNLIGRAHFASAGVIDAGHLPTLSLAPASPSPSSRSSPSESEGRSLKEKLAEMEKLRIVEALRTHKTQREAALALEMPMSTFLARLDAYGIPRARGGGKKE